MSYAGVSPSLIKKYVNYLISTLGVFTRIDIVTSDDLHVIAYDSTYDVFTCIDIVTFENSCVIINDSYTSTWNICQVTLYLYCAKRRMRYNPEKFVLMVVEAWSTYTRDKNFVLRKDSIMECLLICN